MEDLKLGRETIIIDGMGNKWKAHKCNPERCKACPYWRPDVDGEPACYEDEREETCVWTRKK